MRHSIHMMFGRASSEALLELRRYIAMYADDATSQYFTALHYAEDSNGHVSISKVVKKEEEKLTFTSHLNDQWIPEYGEEFDADKDSLKESLKGYVKKLWQQRINTNYAGNDNLHICLYVQLYVPSIWQQVETFILCAKEQLGNKVDIDIVGLCGDLAEVFDPDKTEYLAQKVEELNQKTKETMDKIVAMRRKEATSHHIAHFTIIQNQTTTRALELTLESIVSIAGEFALICIENYDQAFGVNVDHKDIQGIGISMLSFDQYYFQEYILQDSFIKILEKERIHEGEVDITWAAREIDLLLQPHLKLMSEFYLQEIATRRERGDAMTDIMPAILPKLKEKFEGLNKVLTDKILQNENISLPQKKGLLSILLGQDDELFAHGTLINSEQKILIDLERECVNFFVDENNALLDKEETKDEIILPPYSMLVGEDAVKDEDGNPSKKAKLPTDEMKELRFRQRNYIANIREMQDELAELKKNIAQLDESKKCLIEGGKIIFEKEEFQLLHHDDDIVPLEDNYEPHSVSTKNIDISNGFTEIKNQGQQGACMSFSMVSVFEYFLKKNHVQFPDLSEQFLYYNARKRTGREAYDEGSNSVASIQTLSEEGICSEDAWPYKVGGFAEAPTPEAYEDAKHRRVKRAVMVEKKIDTLKSALDDGLPVVFAVDVFPSFGKGVNGFISMPTEEEVLQLKEPKENHSHAMVLCGFNDEQKVFKVRNSWGTDFGDRGYCYLSYDYIMQYGYWDCVAIQEIEIEQEQADGEDGKTVQKIEDTVFTIKQTDRPQLNFSETDLAVRYALRKNFLDRLISELKDLQKYDTKLQEYYEAVKLPLRDRNKRDKFYRASKRHKELQIEDLENAKIENEKEKVTTIAAHKKTTLKTSWTYLGTIGTLSAFCGTCDAIIGKMNFVPRVLNWIPLDIFSIFINQNSIWGKVLGFFLGNKKGLGSTMEALQGWLRFIWIVGIIAIIAFVVFYLWRRINQRKDLELHYQRINRQLNADIADIEENIELLESRFHLAGEMIAQLFALSTKFQQRHSAISHYLLNLREWYSNTVDCHAQMHAEARAPFVSLIRNDILDDYFKDQEESIIEENNVWRFIDKYEPSEEGIIHVQQSIKQDLLQKINTHFAKFSIADYLINLKDKKLYQYLVHDFDDICELFNSLNRKSDIFLQYNIEDEGRDARQVMFVHTNSEEQHNRLEKELRNAVDDMAFESVSSPYKIIFFRKMELDKNQIEL